MSDAQRARYVALFAAETRSLLSSGRRTIVSWSEDLGDPHASEELFRVLHTIKGMAATLGFEKLVELVHSSEESLADIRSGSRGVDRVWLERLESGFDEISVECDQVVAQEGGSTAMDPLAAPEKQAVVQVDLARLDALLADLGATVTARQELERRAAADPFSPISRSAAGMSHRLDALQQRVVQVRLAPLSEVLDRIPPMVRDLARKLGKEVTVDVSGGEIEVDRGILGVLPEPVLHLLRNAVDHGIESPEERRKAAKRSAGKITIRVKQERDTVRVELTDDGRGINRREIARLAHEKGILKAGAELSDEHVLTILARPGFSTAGKITDISGRGVGLDTVMARLHAVGASLRLTTVEGHGTVFTLTLPTRIGIVPALLTVVADNRYVMPLTHVSELVAWEVEQSRTEAGRTVLNVHGDWIPVVDLRRLLMTDDGQPPGRRPAVIFMAGEQRVALLADHVEGQVDAVIQPLERPKMLPRWITGATVLDDGYPALLLDLTSVV